MVECVLTPIFSTADVTHCLFLAGGLTSGVLANIAAYAAFAVFPFMGSFFYSQSITAAIHARMGCGGLCPDDFTGMIVRVHRTICLFANLTSSRSRTGGFAVLVLADILTDCASPAFPCMS